MQSDIDILTEELNKESSEVSHTHCETCQCANKQCVEKTVLDASHLIQKIQADIAKTLPQNVSFFTKIEDDLFAHAHGLYVKVPQNMPLLRTYELDFPSENATPQIKPETVEYVSLKKYKTYIKKQTIPECYKFPYPSESTEFLWKLAYDSKIQYTYDHLQVYYDIETASLNSEFAGVENPTSFISMI